ncbi:MAG: hypothetical protein HYV18_05065 [Gammaproteobacteria bacterium]|nr:hypothetical protein [Gammaproteobacteria bacterium]
MSAPWQPLPWHEGAWRQWIEAQRADRLAHAVLVAGHRGVGKRHFVQGLCTALLCESPGIDGLACGRCRGCVQIAAGLHPNLRRLAPEEGKRDISIDAVRELIERLALSSHYRARKVAVIDPADALNISSVNALLKTIEEPPAGSHLILVTERIMALPATLRSRCRILRFGAPPADAAGRWLAAQFPEVPAERRQAFLRAPLRLADSLDDAWREQREQWRALVDHAAQGRLAVSVKGLEKVRKEEAEGFLAWFVELAAAALRERQRGSAAAGALARVPPRRLSGLLDEAIEGLRRVAGNANPQLLLESLMIRLSQYARMGDKQA